MSRTLKHISEAFTAVILSAILIFSTCTFHVSAYTAAPEGEINFNVSFYDSHEAACNTVVQGISNLDSQIDLSKYQLSKTEATNIMRTVLTMHPEFFFVDNTRFMIGSDGIYAAVIRPMYRGVADELTDSTRQTINNQRDTFNSKVDKILAKTDSTMTDFQKAVVLHDYIVLNCKYNKDYSSTESCTAYSALVEGYATCQGYAGAYSYLLACVGISSEIVESPKMFHVWNKICINNYYYNVDVTWDDPLYDKAGHVSHKYFLLSDAAISGSSSIQSHYGFNTYFQGSSTKYDNEYYHGLDTKFCFYGNEFYAIDNKFESKYEKNLIKVNINTGEIKQISHFDFQWLTEDESSYWPGGYMSLDICNDNLYYNSTDSIYAYNINSGKTECIVDNSGKLATNRYYGMYLVNNDIYVFINKTPNIEGTVSLCDSICEESTTTTTELFTGTVPSKSTTDVPVLGDINSDGNVTISDATLLQKYLAKKVTLTNEQIVCANVNKDNNTDIRDATKIQMLLSRKISSF